MFLTILLAATAAGTGNLLVNPGFESTANGMPAGWDLFVLPMEGAEGRLDETVARSGAHSVRLSQPQPYEREPANNWSQAVWGDIAGKELLVTGHIRTDNATEAALWVQCCARKPWRMLHFVSTRSTTPLRGTHDWTEVSVRVPVPKETEYVMLRCVLLGQGTAWFDDLAVGYAPEPLEPAREATPPPAPATTPARPLETPAPERGTDSERALVETNRTLREMNTALTAQLVALQEEMRRLHDEVSRLRLSGAEESAAPPATAPQWPTLPPLMPYGFNRQTGDVP